MNEYIFTSLIYLIIVCFLGHLIIDNWFKPLIREGARTLPRPVLHPELYEPSYKFKPSPPYFGQTLNQMIDQFIDRYFDKRGLPYTETIQMYVNNCVNQGNVTPENKSRLNDIGYYFLNIVIPNIQTDRNPTPEQNWPPIKWSEKGTFKVAIQPTPTYLAYIGQQYMPSYNMNYNDVLSSNGGELPSTSGVGSGKTDGDGSDGDGDGGNCENDKLNKCGIGCASSCLDGIMGSWYNDGNDNAPGTEGDNMNTSPDTDGSQTYGTSGENISNVKHLPGDSNTLIIGSAEIDGYQITDEPQTNTEVPLNNKINTFITDFFIEDGVHKNKPTQKAIDIFNMYFQYKSPMDGIHMNKMRDVVYYILQVIVPGLPTSVLPRSYVEWRPIVWLSLSERAKR